MAEAFEAFVKVDGSAVSGAVDQALSLVHEFDRIRAQRTLFFAARSVSFGSIAPIPNALSYPDFVVATRATAN